MFVAPMRNLPNLLCQHQTTFSAVDSFGLSYLIGWLKSEETTCWKLNIHLTNRRFSSTWKNYVCLFREVNVRLFNLSTLTGKLLPLIGSL